MSSSSISASPSTGSGSSSSSSRTAYPIRRLLWPRAANTRTQMPKNRTGQRPWSRLKMNLFLECLLDKERKIRCGRSLIDGRLNAALSAARLNYCPHVVNPPRTIFNNSLATGEFRVSKTTLLLLLDDQRKFPGGPTLVIIAWTISSFPSQLPAQFLSPAAETESNEHTCPPRATEMH